MKVSPLAVSPICTNGPFAELTPFALGNVQDPRSIPSTMLPFLRRLLPSAVWLVLSVLFCQILRLSIV